MGKLLIRNGKLVNYNGIVEANMLISGSKIFAIGRSLDKTGDVDRIIDAHGRCILPGGVDAHAHINDPLYATHEDFKTGTTSAAAGGITTLIEMVLKTPVDNFTRIKKKIQTGENHSVVDFSLHAGMMNSKNINNIREICRLGVRSFKTFTCAPYQVDSDTLQALMIAVKENHAILNIHAEDQVTIESNTKRLHQESRIDPLAHGESRPNCAEAKAVAEVINLAKLTGAHVHFSHLSTNEAVGFVNRAKELGVCLSAETCPHYLIFCNKDMKKQGPFLKVNPSLKTKTDNNALWAALRSEMIDIVTSEHAPCTIEEKESGWMNIWNAWSGLPSNETMLPILLSEGVNKGRLKLEDVARIFCKRPAEIFGLYPQKGIIEVGSDADLTIIDLKKEKKVKADELHYKCGWTPYEGMVLAGWPQLVICRGEPICEDGEVVRKSGFGKFVSQHPKCLPQTDASESKGSKW
jgi:D-hydantoinase